MYYELGKEADVKKINLLALLLLILTGCTVRVSAPEKELSTVIVKHAVNIETYETLRERADLIVFVRVTTALNMADSHFDNGDFHNHRHLEVIKVLKSDTDVNEKMITFRESAAIDADSLYVSENVTPLEIDEEVILFLDKTDNEDYVLTNETEGVVYTEDLLRNTNLEIACNTIFEFMNPKYLNRKLTFRPLELTNKEDGSGYDRLTIETDLYPIEVELSKSLKVAKIFDTIFKFK